MILADVFYRYTAARYLATVNRRHFRHCMLFQSTKTSLVVCCRRYQTPKTPALRVGLRSRPSIAKRCRKSEGDGRSSLLESDSSLAFSKALEAHMIPSQLTWRKQPTSPRHLSSPARFLCSFLFQKKARTPRQKARTPQITSSAPRPRSRPCPPGRRTHNSHAGTDRRSGRSAWRDRPCRFRRAHFPRRRC